MKTRRQMLPVISANRNSSDMLTQDVSVTTAFKSNCVPNYLVVLIKSAVKLSCVLNLVFFTNKRAISCRTPEI